MVPRLLQDVPAHAPRSLHSLVDGGEPDRVSFVRVLVIVRRPVAEPSSGSNGHRLDGLAHPTVQVYRGRGHLVYPRGPSLDGVQFLQNPSERAAALPSHPTPFQQRQISLGDGAGHRGGVPLEHGSLLGGARGVQRPSRRVRLRLALHELRPKVVQLDGVFSFQRDEIFLRPGQRGRGRGGGGGGDVVRIVRRERPGDEVPRRPRGRRNVGPQRGAVLRASKQALDGVHSLLLVRRQLCLRGESRPALHVERRRRGVEVHAQAVGDDPVALGLGVRLREGVDELGDLGGLHGRRGLVGDRRVVGLVGRGVRGCADRPRAQGRCGRGAHLGERLAVSLHLRARRLERAPRVAIGHHRLRRHLLGDGDLGVGLARALRRGALRRLRASLRDERSALGLLQLRFLRLHPVVLLSLSPHNLLNLVVVSVRVVRRSRGALGETVRVGRFGGDVRARGGDGVPVRRRRGCRPPRSHGAVPRSRQF